MILATIYRSVFTRLLAALIVVLVLSPYSEPFATIDGTDFSGAGAVDVEGGSKLKSSTHDALMTPPVLATIVGALASDPDASRPQTLDSRRSQRTILRL